MASLATDNDVMEETARLLTRISKCFVFKVPSRGPLGYSAAQMKEHPVFSGSLEIHAKGREAAILVKREGKVYCMAPIRVGGAEAYEQCYDSSRYFALRIEDPKSKRTATIGLGFNAREESLEFKVTVQDFLTQIKREVEFQASGASSSDTAREPSLDLKLKEGQKIKISMPKSSLKKKTDASKASKSRKSASGGLAPPPPKSGGRRRRKKKQDGVKKKKAEKEKKSGDNIADSLLGLSM